MYEADLLALIGGGENARVDFKRELDLNASNGKAEFIKDIIAIANSSPTRGFLLIGVDDDKTIIGAASLHEERIQQIAETYINPPIGIKCENIPIASSGFLSIGVIEIKATNRPHKVSRAISFLNQNDVFLRHGTIVTKTSPEEIIQMHEEDNELSRLSRQYIRSAETHIKLENYEIAIAAYSKAIETTPSAELFLARAKAGLMHYRKNKKQGSEAYIQFTKDLTDAISLTSSKALEKESRLLRYKEGWGIYYRCPEKDI